MIVSLPRVLAVTLLLTACGSTPGNTTAIAAEPTLSPTNNVSTLPPDTTSTRSNTVNDVAPATDNLASEHATIVAELRRLLVGTDATLDGAAITDVAQIDACRTRFVTGKGATNVEWAKGGNIAPRNEAGRELNDLPGSDGAHILSVRTGEEADGISGAVGLLVGECDGGER